MGVAQNSMLALLGTAGVAASKVSGSIKGAGGSSGLNEQSNLISQAIDADRNAMAAEKASLNMQKMRFQKQQLKFKSKELRFKEKKLDDKIKAYKEGGKK